MTDHSVEVFCEESCGNAPKKLLLKDFTIAFANNDYLYMENHTTDDICWNIVGDKRIQGKEQFLKAAEQIKEQQVIELHISNIITHGKLAAVNGRLNLENDICYEICDIYLFSSSGKDAKIKEITSYIIKVFC
ncbi:hypothetical protein ACFSTA_14505 [Ornithinibacillus salinisoli]|uniref:Nuclear transport factor 2 family protein n=1 Tax=Ornithinibacillus salinisoli TaxID=1848459 RepID=A0ABW4W2W5_9BACI